MTSLSDVDLLQRYTTRTPEAERAFALLVERHLNLVFSVARRQVRSPHLAEEVAQSVFVDLAHNAARIDRDAPLAAWLHLVSRRTAVDVVRRESRRQAREKAAALLADLKPSPSSWAAIEPLLDEAVESLPPADRHAILLRFFENKSLREVGAALGTNDDAAQKRVGRALEQLREFFLKRGVSVTAAGLAADLSAFTLETAPAALGAGITSAVAISASAISPTLASAVPTMALTAVQKTALTLASVAIAGVIIYETSLLIQQRQDLAATRERSAQVDARLQLKHAAHTKAISRQQEAHARLAGLARLSGSDPDVEQAIDAWLRRLDRLRQLAASQSEYNLPELVALTENEWFAAAREAAFDTEEQTRETFRKLHETARNSLASAFSRALTRYVDAHDGLLPTNPSQLAAHLDRHLPPELFERCEMLRSGAIANVPSGEWILAERLDLARARDSRLYVTGSGSGTEDLSTISDREFRLAVRAFAANSGGRLPTEAGQLVDHFSTPPTAAALKAFLAKPTSDFTPDALKKLLSPP